MAFRGTRLHAIRQRQLVHRRDGNLGNVLSRGTRSSSSEFETDGETNFASAYAMITLPPPPPRAPETATEDDTWWATVLKFSSESSLFSFKPERIDTWRMIRVRIRRIKLSGSTMTLTDGFARLVYYRNYWSVGISFRALACEKDGMMIRRNDLCQLPYCCCYPLSYLVYDSQNDLAKHWNVSLNAG